MTRRIGRNEPGHVRSAKAKDARAKPEPKPEAKAEEKGRAGLAESQKDVFVKGGKHAAQRATAGMEEARAIPTPRPSPADGRSGVPHILGRAVVDSGFRETLFRNPDEALEGHALTEQEAAALRTLDRDAFEAVAHSLRERVAQDGPDPDGDLLLRKLGDALSGLGFDLIERKRPGIELPPGSQNIGGATHKDSWKGEG